MRRPNDDPPPDDPESGSTARGPSSGRGPGGRRGKGYRQHRVARLLETEVVTSQAQLVELLAAEGIVATQATVSRDLEELGALKVRVAGGVTAYAIPELPAEQVAPEEHLARVLGEWVVDLAVSGNLLVIRTPPGCAHVVASALDRVGRPGVLGTVAGDDTMVVVVDEGVGGKRVAADLAHLAGLAWPPRRRVLGGTTAPRPAAATGAPAVGSRLAGEVPGASDGVGSEDGALEDGAPGDAAWSGARSEGAGSGGARSGGR